MATDFARRGKHVALGLVLALAVGLGAPEKEAEAGSRYRTRGTRIAKGVKFIRMLDRRGPNRIKILKVNLAAGTTIDTVLAQDQLPGFEKTSSMASRSSAVAAINGDYARPTGRPVFTFAADGYLAQTPLTWGRNFAVDAPETQAFIGHPQVSVWARDTDAGLAYEGKKRVNDGPATRRQVARFTPAGGTEEISPAGTCQARMLPVEPPRTVAETTGVEATHEVEMVECGGASMSPEGGSVLQTPADGDYAPALASLTPGEQVVLGWSLGWPGVLDTVGGNPTLIENGAIAESNVNGTGSFFNRHPRTGVGYSASTGRVFFVTVDGRRKGSVGMTLRAFAKLFKKLGAEWALNLDGGGSTTMFVNGAVVNRPSDKDANGNRVERGVSSSIVILPGADPGEAPPPSQEEPTGIPIPPVNDARVARLAVSDPASLGGLASYLRSIGRWLPPSLRRAADSFDASR